MTNVGYWVPISNEKNALYYVLSFPNIEAKEKAWKDFVADPEWKKVQSKSEESGTEIPQALLRRSALWPGELLRC